MSKASRIMPLALLHSLLQQQSFYGRNAFVHDYDWTLTDLALAVEAFKKVMTKCPCGSGVSNLVSQIYSNHCTDLVDARVVEALAKLLSEYAADPTKHVSFWEKIIVLTWEMDEIIICLLRAFKERQARE